MEELGVEVSGYDSCNFDINRNFLFQGDWMKPFHRLVPSILEEIPVLIYAGDADFICNVSLSFPSSRYVFTLSYVLIVTVQWLGNQAWVKALEWPGQKAFNKADVNDLTLSGKKYGHVQSSGNFTFMRIFAAGHMVPLNQPEPSLDFVNRWVRGEWF